MVPTMSGDELVVLIASSVLVFWLWAPWVQLCLSPANFGRNRPLRQLGLAAPAVACAGILFVLATYASHDVRDSTVYLLFYTAMGAAWLGAAMKFTGLFGLSLRDDWLERHNAAAGIAGTGVLLGAAAAFAGANIGDGPGWWVVCFCAALSTVALGAAWWLYAKLSDAMERITVDRDRGAGWRLAGFLVAAGIICGRSVAGNWQDAGATLHDFINVVWPLLPYAIIAGGVEGRLADATSPNAASVKFGTLAVHAAGALAFLAWAGPWN